MGQTGGQLAKSGAADECRSLFAFWRNVVMGNLGARTPLSPAAAGYFYVDADADAAGGPVEPRPLGAVRRDLVRLVDRTDLTDEERWTVHLYYGLHELPLPFSSKAQPDLAAGRDESSPRGACGSALTKMAGRFEPRPLAGAPRRRGSVNPLLESWFRDLALTRPQRQRLVARAYVRVVSRCDGPHAGPTRAGVARWYRDCGFADPDLVATQPGPPPRPNRNALARAAALMEIALYEEADRPERDVVGQADAPPTPGSHRLRYRPPETVTHPELVALLTGDTSPEGLVAAATSLKNEALDGSDVTGRLALLQRYLRPRLDELPGPELERVAAAISYVGAVDGDPFLVLEWLGHFLDRVGITDRTFTLLVNGSEAAAGGGYHGLAARLDRWSVRLRRQWRIPLDQIPMVEHFEAEQQRLVASAHRLEQLGVERVEAGDHRAAAELFLRSATVAARSAGMANVALTDRKQFPRRELPGKAGRHGGDLTESWLLAALLRVTEPLTHLRDLLDDPVARSSIDARDLGRRVGELAALVESYLGEHDLDPELPHLRRWHDRVRAQTAELLDRAVDRVDRKVWQ